VNISGLVLAAPSSRGIDGETLGMIKGNDMIATIRLAQENKDAEVIASIYAPFCTNTSISFECTAPTACEMGARIHKTTIQFPWLVMDIDGRIAGYSYAGPHREYAAYNWSVDVSVYVDLPFRRKGIGRSLYTALFRLLTLQGYYKTFAGVSLPNPASTGLHESLGFELVGEYRGVGYKFGAWHDVRWYQLALRTEIPNPAPPIPIHELINTERWTETISNAIQYSDTI
jgi:L-amino acid N-acyltransferase YncA